MEYLKTIKPMKNLKHLFLFTLILVFLGISFNSNAQTKDDFKTIDTTAINDEFKTFDTDENSNEFEQSENKSQDVVKGAGNRQQNRCNQNNRQGHKRQCQERGKNQYSKGKNSKTKKYRNKS